MLNWLIAALVLVLSTLIACRYGADSRDGRDWRPQTGAPLPLHRGASHRNHSPADDLRAAFHLMGRSRLAGRSGEVAQVKSLR